MQRSQNSRMMKMAAGPVRPATSSLPGNSVPSAIHTPSPDADAAGAVSQEYSVRVPDASHKQHNLMRFNGALHVDFAKWNSVKLQREDNSALHKAHEFQTVEMPKFGAGSEYGREQREEARRRKYGMNRKKYKPEDQPWILKESNKKYKGLRDGGVNENASYFIFTQGQDGCFEVFPVKQWFNFTTIARYKSLTAEEAEEQFSKRHKVVNHFSIMLQKRLRDDEEGAGETNTGEKKAKRGKGDMLISDMDDWVDDDGIGEDSEEEDSSKKKKKAAPAKKKKGDSDDDPMEESDDGDEEGRERDYTSDSSAPTEDEDEKKPEMSGVDQEAALKSLLDSDSSSDEEKEKEKKEEKEEKKEEEGEKKKKSKKNKKKNREKEEKDETDASPPPNVIDELAEDLPKPEVKKEPSTPSKTDYMLNPNNFKAPPKVFESDVERIKHNIIHDVNTEHSATKKSKVEVPSSTLQMAATEGITEESVRKYLLRKPMTIAELLQKFKPRKSKMGSNDLVPVIAHILKKLNPTKRTQQNKMYFFLNKS